MGVLDHEDDENWCFVNETNKSYNPFKLIYSIIYLLRDSRHPFSLGCGVATRGGRAGWAKIDI